MLSTESLYSPLCTPQIYLANIQLSPLTVFKLYMLHDTEADTEKAVYTTLACSRNPLYRSDFLLCSNIFMAMCHPAVQGFIYSAVIMRAFFRFLFSFPKSWSTHTLNVIICYVEYLSGLFPSFPWCVLKYFLCSLFRGTTFGFGIITVIQTGRYTDNRYSCNKVCYQSKQVVPSRARHLPFNLIGFGQLHSQVIESVAIALGDNISD